jgi:acyltransferase
METEPQAKRIQFIDIARFYAMALVFFGHFIEELMLLKNPAGAAFYKFIYSFHMVLFIVLSGYITKPRDLEWGIGKFFKHRFLSRLLPFIFFTFLMMIPPIFFSGKFFGLLLPSVEGYAKGLVSTVFGIPMFDVPSWFLMLIFSVELVHYTSFRFLKNSDAKILAAIVIFYAAGYLLNLKLDIFNPLKGRTVGWNYLFIHEAITMYAFFLMGVLLRRRRFLMDMVSLKILAPGAVIAFLVVLFTYRLNQGPFNFHAYDAVVIIFASHGHMLLFPLTAIAGCTLILLIAKMGRMPKTAVWLGQNTLLLMCLNGIFYHYINPPAAKWILANFPHSAASIFVIGCFVTVASLSACIPLVYLFNKYIPQLVGKPAFNGPILNRLV